MGEYCEPWRADGDKLFDCNGESLCSVDEWEDGRGRSRFAGEVGHADRIALCVNALEDVQNERLQGWIENRTPFSPASALQWSRTPPTAEGTYRYRHVGSESGGKPVDVHSNILVSRDGSTPVMTCEINGATLYVDQLFYEWSQRLGPCF